MEQIMRERPNTFLRTLYYWILLFFALWLVDDGTIGWIFIVAAQFNLFAAAILAFVFYWAGGYWLTLRGLSPKSGKVSAWLLERLNLGHAKNKQLHEFEQQRWSKITSVTTAIPMTMVFGGVFTVLWLYRRGVVDTRRARRIGFWLCGLYALEPTAIHAIGLGALVLFIRHHLGY